MSDRAKLPLGAYVCQVKKVAVQDTDYGAQLAILLDISEGEFKEFFNKDFQGNQNADRKWRGVIRQWLPKDDGSEKDEITKRIFKGLVTSFENSNPGFKWNWDATSLVGKTVGVLFRNEEYDFQGRQGWAVRPFRCMTADKVRSGDYTLPDNKPLNNSGYRMGDANDTALVNKPQNTFVEVEVDELPF
jgi:hypothetical protein